MCKKAVVPPDSLVAAYLPADHADAFRVIVPSPLSSTPDDLMVSFWSDMPGWVGALFRVRNALVRIVGLRGGRHDTARLERCIREGGSYGAMSIPARDGRETVCLLTDRHLDAYLSVRITGECEVVVSTLVHFHNRLGRLYFFLIRPFHNLIVPAMLRRALREK